MRGVLVQKDESSIGLENDVELADHAQYSQRYFQQGHRFWRRQVDPSWNWRWLRRMTNCGDFRLRCRRDGRLRWLFTLRPGWKWFARSGRDKVRESARFRDWIGILQHQRFRERLLNFWSHRRSRLLHPLMMLQQRFSHRLGDYSPDRLFLAELHLAFRGMNIHIHERGINFQEKATQRIPALHQHGVVPLNQSKI